MRYLNKIIFINSADKSIKYAEINLDGNVHFIGTQGVGKSTLLRAILFFYNADKVKLGIAKEKKTFDEYYFPFQNSYIVYEIHTENGFYCVLAYKSQGRVAFRFFDSAFNKNYFIDNEGRAYENWDKTREAFGKHIYYTKIINSYEEYRNILYGNNKGLQSEFRKYAIIESKQYQNIPRTITNVFLNTNLSAEFVKETIIKSLNEDDIKIDLATYSQNHLRDFEANLNDIKLWTDRSRNGENSIEKQADNVSKFYSALKYLERRKIELALQLGWAIHNLKEQKPKADEKLKAEELKKKKLDYKYNNINEAFNKNKEKSLVQIGLFKDKLDEIKKKKVHYQTLNIDIIIARVSKKMTLELERKNLITERDIITFKFHEIKQRYEALLKQLTNQSKEFENSKQTEKNSANELQFQLKEKIIKEYELQIDEINRQHKVELNNANELVKEKAISINNLRIKFSEIKNKRFYEIEIEKLKSENTKLLSAISKAENYIHRYTEKIKSIQKEWELEVTIFKTDTSRKVEIQNDLQKTIADNIFTIDSRIENSKESFYGWLNDKIPGWEKTVGKVIDEENVLFKSGLNPRMNSKDDLSFYGISIDTNEINKTVKTIADYEKDKDELITKNISVQQTIAGLNAHLNDELEKLKRRFQPKIRELKEAIQNNEYAQNQSKTKIEEVEIQLKELNKKAVDERNKSLEMIDNEIFIISEEEIKANKQVYLIESSINKQIEAKKKDKENRVKVEQQILADTLNKFEDEIKSYKIDIGKKETEIKEQQKKEFDSKGADTKRISEIDLDLSKIDFELTFIENNRDTIAEYNKDKRELFDKEEEFKIQKLQFEKQLESDLTKHKMSQQKLTQEIEQLSVEIDYLNNKLKELTVDLSAYESFLKTELFQTLTVNIEEYSETSKTDFRCIKIIEELNQTHYTLKDRFTDLQEAVNKFTGNFQENNIFSFKTKFTQREDYLEFADLLKEFIEEDKINEFKKRVEERFAHIIRQIGKETGDLISKEGEIHQVISDINKDFIARKFVQAIKSMELRTVQSANRIFLLLVEIKKFNDIYSFSLGSPNLFAQEDLTNKNEKAISLLKQLIKEMMTYKEREITLSDSFELQFRIVENDNDTNWVEKLSNVGSDGTDILVKAMINIMLLNVFKDRATKKQKDDFRLHCMMDEIGKLHPNNVKGILKFANDRNILLINSSPTSYNAIDYRYTYLLAKDSKNITSIKRLVRKIPNLENEDILKV